MSTNYHKMEFLNEYSDMVWLFETHLSFLYDKRKRFHSAMLYGNSDYPLRIDLYVEKDPTVKDLYTIITFE